MAEETKIPKLKYVESMHEQREMHHRVTPIKGAWVEVGEFSPVIETFDIKERWECTECGKSECGMFKLVTLKKKDFKKQDVYIRKVANEVINKHGDLMYASLMKAIVKGAYKQKDQIALFKARVNTKTDEEYDKAHMKIILNSDVERLKINISKKEETMRKLKKRLKMLEGEQNGQKNN